MDRAAHLRVLPLLRPHAARLVAGSVCLLLLAAAGGLQAYLTGPLVQIVLSGGRLGGQYLTPLIPGPWQALLTDARPTLVLVAGLLVALALVKGLAHLGQARLLGGTAERVGHELRVDLYRHLLDVPLLEHRRLAVGDTLSRLLDDVTRVQAAAVGALLAFVREGLSALGLLAVAIGMAPGLTLTAVLALPPLALGVTALSRAVRRAAGVGQERLGQMAGQAAESLLAIREIKSFAAQARQVAAFTRLSAGAMRFFLRGIGIKALSPLVNEVLAALALGLSLLFGGAAIAQGTLEPERFISFFVAAVLLYRPIKELGQAHQALAAGRASADRVAELLALPLEDQTPGKPLPALRREVRLETIQFRYQPDSPPALTQVDLRLGLGTLVALCGPSGAGKTTLANLVCGLVRPTSGRLLWDGEDLVQTSLSSLRSRTALVPQQPLLFAGTLIENLRFGAPDASLPEIEEALAAAGLATLPSRWPTGLDTVLGPSTGIQLSVGEVQRVAVARAILRRVDLLVLDEPSAALDPENEALLVQTLLRLRTDRAVLCIAHRPALIQAADQVIRLDQGRLVAKP